MSGAGSRTELVGRAVLSKQVIAALDNADSFGALLVGEAGVGKTAVAGFVAEHVQRTAPVLTVTGGSSLRKIPYGALAPYLHGLSVADAGSPVAILRAVMSHLPVGATGQAQQPPVVVVDDAHELDDSSSAILAQLMSARRARVLILMRDSPTAPAEFRNVSADGLLTRFDVQPLDVDEVSLVCSQVLGGPVLTGTSRLLAQLTSGNPRFLRILLEQGLAEGFLTRRNGVWRLTTEQPLLHPQLGDLIRAQLERRAPEDVLAMETIALAEPMPFGALSQCVDAGALERLRADRLVTVGPGPDQPVSLEPPLYGEVLRRQVPAARSVLIRRTLLAVMEPGSQFPEGFVRYVSWSLDVGVPPDDTTLLKAAAVANALRGYDFALRAAHAVRTPGLRGRALVEIARGQYGRGNLDYARELVEEALRSCADLRLAQDATRLSFELKLTSGAPVEDLRSDIDRWTSLVAELEVRESAAVTAAAEVRQARLGIRILESHLLILQGRFDGVEEELRSISADAEATPETRVGALMLLAELLGSMGRSVEACDSSGAALALIDEHRVSLVRYREGAAARHTLVLVGAGRGSEAKALLQEYSRAHPCSIVYFAGWSDVVDGITALRAARNRDARDRFVLAVEALREWDPTQALTLLIGLVAYTSALAGDLPRARASVEEFEGTPERGSRFMRLTGRTHVTGAAALLGHAPGARTELLRIAQAAEKHQMQELAAMALSMSLGLGETSAVGPLIRVLQHRSGAEAQELLNFAMATRDKDVGAMVDAATAAGEHGNAAFEYSGLIAARELMAKQGLTRQARLLQRRLAGLQEQREDSASSLLGVISPSADIPRLTPTERKIVVLVKQGSSNREIAEAKGVSVRTVEGHLYRIFTKLGVNRREDLPDF